MQAMAKESTSWDFLTDDDASAQLFKQARGTERAEPIELPWLDVDKALLFAVSERPGDDVAVALATGLAQRTAGCSSFGWRTE